MKTIIIYGSKYGTSKAYAIELSRKTNIEVLDYKSVKNLDDYTSIIYIGGLYAGGLYGLKDFLKRNSVDKNKDLYIVTVGLADPKNKENTTHIKKSLEKRIPSYLYNENNIFHLRGGIDYSKLTKVHFLMMKALYNKTKKLPVEKQNVETKALIETYNKSVNFVDFKSLDELISKLKI